jgi:hypothetical protein
MGLLSRLARSIPAIVRSMIRLRSNAAKKANIAVAVTKASPAAKSIIDGSVAGLISKRRRSMLQQKDREQV